MRGMNKLDRNSRARILHMLCEGQSIRATARLTGASKNTITKLLVDAGMACAAYQDRVLRNLPCKRVQFDEIWSFVYAKQANVGKSKSPAGNAGDVWTWTAICADTKLLVSYYVGDRGYRSALEFTRDVSDRLAGRIQLTTDGHHAYAQAIETVFGDEIDYAQLQKIYGSDPAVKAERRYSPAICIGIRLAT